MIGSTQPYTNWFQLKPTLFGSAQTYTDSFDSSLHWSIQLKPTLMVSTQTYTDGFIFNLHWWVQFKPTLNKLNSNLHWLMST